MNSSSSAEPDAVVNTCRFCDQTENLLRCSRCKLVYYCSKDHQRRDWKRHKPNCPSGRRRDYVKTVVNQSVAGVLPSEGSSEDEVLNSRAEILNPNLELFNNSSSETLESSKTTMPIGDENMVHPRFPEVSLRGGLKLRDYATEEMCRNVIRDMNAYGVCVVDHFLGEERGKAVLAEVLNMYTKGIFKDGQLVTTTKGDQKSIRGDQITWIDGKEKYCQNIGYLIGQVDAVIIRANKMLNNGKLGSYTINGRTKVSVYKQKSFSLPHVQVDVVLSLFIVSADSMPGVTYAKFARAGFSFWRESSSNNKI